MKTATISIMFLFMVVLGACECQRTTKDIEQRIWYEKRVKTYMPISFDFPIVEIEWKIRNRNLMRKY